MCTLHFLVYGLWDMLRISSYIIPNFVAIGTIFMCQFVLFIFHVLLLSHPLREIHVFFSLLHSQKPFMSSSYVRLVALPKEHWDCNISCGVIMFSCRDSIVSSMPFIIYLLAMSLYPIQQPYAFCTLQIQF